MAKRMSPFSDSDSPDLKSKSTKKRGNETVIVKSVLPLGNNPENSFSSNLPKAVSSPPPKCCDFLLTA